MSRPFNAFPPESNMTAPEARLLVVSSRNLVEVGIGKFKDGAMFIGHDIYPFFYSSKSPLQFKDRPQTTTVF